jgi:hypothetical protein
MKKLMTWSILMLVVMSLAACAPATSAKTIKVKCPACGYEFDVPTKSQH